MVQTAKFDADALANSVVTQLVAPVFVASVWKSGWVDVKAARRLTAIIAANQAFVTNGVVIEQSNATNPSADSDAHYWTASESDGVTISTHPVTGQTYYNVAFSVERVGLYARLVVKHGASVPTVFFARLIGAGIT